MENKRRSSRQLWLTIGAVAVLMAVMALILSSCGRAQPAAPNEAVPAEEATVAAPAAQEPAAEPTVAPEAAPAEAEATPAEADAEQAAAAEVVEGSQAAQSTELRGIEPNCAALK